MNAVLEQGAEGFGFAVVQPRFDGHELCTDQPWVQGMRDQAPFHPTAAGELTGGGLSTVDVYRRRSGRCPLCGQVCRPGRLWSPGGRSGPEPGPPGCREEGGSVVAVPERA
jgi:hypothetical protein